MGLDESKLIKPFLTSNNDLAQGNLADDARLLTRDPFLSFIQLHKSEDQPTTAEVLFFLLQIVTLCLTLEIDKIECSFSVNQLLEENVEAIQTAFTV
jgi:hypothetical protein